MNIKYEYGYKYKDGEEWLDRWALALDRQLREVPSFFHTLRPAVFAEHLSCLSS